MEPFFSMVCSLTIVGSIMTAAVLVLRGLFKFRIRTLWFVILWILVIGRFCIPISVASPFSVLNLLSAQSVSDPGKYVTAVPDYIGGERAGFPAEGNPSLEGNPGDPVLSSERAESQQPPLAAGREENGGPEKVKASPGPDWLRTGSRIWLTGMCVSLLCLVSRYRTNYMRAKTIRRLTAGEIAAIKTDSGLEDLFPVWVTDDPAAPYVSGLLNQKILLPERMIPIEGECGEERSRKQHVFLHEWIHAKRRDNLKRLLSLLALCVHWFNPLMWAACVCLQKDLERSCDEGVVSRLGVGAKKAYASSLFQFVKEGNENSMKAFVSFGESGAKGRVRNILNYEKMSPKWIAAALMISICLCTGFVTNPAVSSPPTRAGGEGASWETMVYTEADGIYCVKPGNMPKLLIEGRELSSPVFSQDGSVLAFFQGSELYAYRFSDGRIRRLAEAPLSFCPGEADRFYVSTKEDGVRQMGIEGPSRPIPVLEAVGKETETQGTEGEWAQCEDLSLSPNGRFLAVGVRLYRWDDQASDGSRYQKDLGVYLFDLWSKDHQAIAVGTGEQEGKNPWEPPAEESGWPFPYLRPLKWSGNSETLFLWNDIHAVSLRADGISGAVYDLNEGTLTTLEEMEGTETAHSLLLSYPENVSFSENGTLFLVGGSGRDMAADKQLRRVTFQQKGSENQARLETLPLSGLIPAMPKVTRDGRRVYFAGAKEAEGEITDWNALYPMKRQLYEWEDGTITPLTSDPAYLCESPILSRDEELLFFGRITSEGAMSLWKVSVEGTNLEKLADLKGNTVVDTSGLTRFPGEPENPPDFSNYPVCYDDYYGRGDWSRLFAVY